MTTSLTARHRAQQLVVRQATMAQVARVWPVMKWEDLDGSYDRLHRVVTPIVASNRRTSAGLTASYLRASRSAAGVRGNFTPKLASAVDVDQFETSLRVSSSVALKKAAARGMPAEVALNNALTLTQMAMSRLTLNGGRDTLTQTIAADPRAVGYERVLGGSGCDFCQMLAGRGAVYGSDSVEFEAHDRCGCTGSPVYS